MFLPCCWLFKDAICECIDKLIPSRTNNGRYKSPWTNRHITRMRRKKARLHKRAKRTDRPEQWKAYRLQHRSTDRASDQAHLDSINELLEPSIDQKNKNLHKFIKSHKKDTFGISTLAANGKRGNTSRAKAEMLNEQFCSVFN